MLCWGCAALLPVRAATLALISSSLDVGALVVGGGGAAAAGDGGPGEAPLSPLIPCMRALAASSLALTSNFNLLGSGLRLCGAGDPFGVRILFCALSPFGASSGGWDLLSPFASASAMRILSSE